MARRAQVQPLASEALSQEYMLSKQQMQRGGVAAMGLSKRMACAGMDSWGRTHP